MGRDVLTHVAAVAPLTDFSLWARGDLLQIILLVLGALLLTRLAEWIRGLVVARINKRAAEAGNFVSEGAKRHAVVAQVLTWCVLAVVYVVTAFMVITKFGVPIESLVAPAALLSAALGFGLQRFVQDIGAGLFLTGERQYGFGDLVRINVSGVSEPSTGTVEEVTLRVTRIRTDSGEVVIIPNGQIIQVTNLSREWARTVIDVPVPTHVDVSHALEVLEGVGERAYEEEGLRRKMLDEPAVRGIEQMNVDTFTLRLVARTLPGMQFEVGRELRARILSAFWAEGVMVSAEVDASHPTKANS
ncbi:MAG TPA: mechanosensitive ion channel domain-containing protein [Trebonia sp.]|jgi:small conductance mechanosensitive channel|nr:mechanosensitive ion channel domain-containing protein [Trebonia sp.]